MQLAGDEKKIRAWFSEQSLVEAQAAPRFEKLWREALLSEIPLAQPAPRFSKSLVAVTATILVAAAVLVVAWSTSKTPVQQQNAQTATPPAIENQPTPNTAEPERQPEKTAVVHRRTLPSSTRRRTLARRQQSERALEKQAALLTNWESPTADFMTSPTRSGFDSLPQLTESVTNLQSFLPKKESN
ncbi:MAG TPA: hypothetical protein VLB87_00800 [Pyrinomonadaceae bacterium]|nr:hypothetical protein [Pyrinomonadaceae bacterium]